jgi:uncharacterized protein (TIGR00297 family)
VLWAFFLAGTVATRLGYRRKAASGLAQADSGRRGAAHVVANCLVPAALLLLGVRSVAFVAAFAAALADTLGTEIGTLFGKRPFSPLTLSPLPAGTPGAVSLPGAAASLAGAAAIALASVGLAPCRAVAWAVALGGFLGPLPSLLFGMGARFDSATTVRQRPEPFVGDVALRFAGTARRAAFASGPAVPLLPPLWDRLGRVCAFGSAHNLTRRGAS